MHEVPFANCDQKNGLVSPGDSDPAYRRLAVLARISPTGNVADLPLGAAGLAVIVELNDMLCFTAVGRQLKNHRTIRPSEYPHFPERSKNHEHTRTNLTG